jgi:hypothetical protein
MKRLSKKTPPRRRQSRRPPDGRTGRSFEDNSASGKSVGEEPSRRSIPPASAARKVNASSAAKHSRSDDHSSETSKIGFRKPPKSYSWRQGQSGNPKGRKKGSKNRKTIIISLMEGRLGRKIPDPKKLTAQEGLLWKAIQKGLAGDAKAMAFAFKRYDDATASSWVGPVFTTEEDQQVYAALRAKIRCEIAEEEDAGK